MTKICKRPGCGKSVESRRRDAKFCSGSCRAYAGKAKFRLSKASGTTSTQAEPQGQETRPTLPEVEEELIEHPDFFVYDLDQGGYDSSRPQVKPRDTVGRIARVEEILHDLRQSFWALYDTVDKLQRKAPRPDSGSVNDARIQAIVRTEVAEALRLRERLDRSPVTLAPQPTGEAQRISRLEVQLRKLTEELRGVKEQIEALTVEPEEDGYGDGGGEREDGDEDEDEDDLR